MSALAGYAAFINMVRTGLLYVGVAVGLICTTDWAVRSRRINPFSGTARFFRSRIEPAMQPVERMVVRQGGVPSATPWWTLMAVVLAGILLISLLDFGGSVVSQFIFGWQEPGRVPRLLAGWGFSLLRLALIVRVVSTWLPVQRFWKWIRWSFFLTEWMLAPLRRIIPLIGSVDITPIVAWLLLNLLQSVLGLS